MIAGKPKARRNQATANSDGTSAAPAGTVGQQQDLLKKLDELYSKVKKLEQDLSKERKKTEDLEKKVKQQEEKSGKKKNGQPRYWRKDEHQRFMEALEKYGRKDVKSIALHVGTRNPTQVRTHAQKWFLKQKREAENKRKQEEEQRAKKLEEQRQNAMKYFQHGYWHAGMFPPFGYPFPQNPKMPYPMPPKGQPGAYGMRPAFLPPYANAAWDQRFSPEEVRILLTTYNMFQDKPDVAGAISRAGILPGRSREDIANLLSCLSEQLNYQPNSSGRPLKRQRRNENATQNSTPTSYQYSQGSDQVNHPHYRSQGGNTPQAGEQHDEKKQEPVSWNPTLSQVDLEKLAHMDAQASAGPPPSSFGTPTSPPPPISIACSKPLTPVNSLALRSLSDTMHIKRSPPHDKTLASSISGPDPDSDGADRDVLSLTQNNHPEAHGLGAMFNGRNPSISPYVWSGSVSPLSMINQGEWINPLKQER